MDNIEGSLIKPRGDGAEPVDIKRVMPVDPQSGDPQAVFAQGDAFIQRKRDIIYSIMLELYHWLGDDEEVSMSAAATHLKNTLGEDYYREKLREARLNHLSEAIDITPELKLTRGGYYVTRD